METEDWQRVETLFHAALELSVAEREAFVTQACEGNTALRAELESLINAYARGEAFLEEPVFNTGLKMLAAEATLVGQTIGDYQIERLLGKGGMGEVYLAQDTRLGRPVALKFLARHLAADPWARRQLIKEAQAVARLDHPNICTVHGLEEAAGHSFIVMQFVEGTVLSDLMRLGKHHTHTSSAAGQVTGNSTNGLGNGLGKGLELEQALPLALQMADALAVAHAHSIIHRDIKPQNLMVTANGQLKVLDFGLAKVVQNQPGGRVAEGPSQASRNGLIAGTVAYMSPEQLRAERLDYRSDIFSVGVVLYTMLTGRHPFLQGSDADTIAAILQHPPPPWPRRLNGKLRSFELILGKCLAKDKEQRYQSANELSLDLQQLQAGVLPRRALSQFYRFATGMFLALFVIVAVWAYGRLTTVPVLAILPFTNQGVGTQYDYLLTGLSESLANQLARLPKVRIKAPTLPTAQKEPLTDPVRIARDLGADAVLVGEARSEEGAIFLTARLIKTKDGSQVWAKSLELAQTDALTLQHALATEIVAHLGRRLSEEEQRLLQTPLAARSEAIQEYWRGRHYWHRRNKENIQLAIDKFNHAIALDPAFALAYTGLADSYILLTSPAYGQMSTQEAVTRARAAARQALEKDDNLPEAHTSLGVVKLKHDWDWQGAAAEFRRAIVLNPAYAAAHYWYSNLLLIQGHAGDAIAESALARDLDPFSPSMNLSRCRAWYWTRQYDNAARCFNDMLSQDPTNNNARYILGLVYLAQGHTDRALPLFQDLYKTNAVLAAAPLGYTYGKLERRAEAAAVLAHMQELEKQAYLPPQEFAIVHVGLGQYDQAFAWLEKAYQERFAYLIYLTIEPLFDSLHGDPRFTNLARRLNLTPPD